MNMNKSLRKAEIFKGTSDFLDEGKKLASNVYDHSVDAIQDVEESVKEYSGKIVESAKQNPISTALIVGGISALITLLLSKR